MLGGPHPRVLTLVFISMVLGCGGEDSEPVIEPPAACASDEWLSDDGACIAAGLPRDMPCPPGEWLRDDGVCIPAGVPPDGCGEGFAYDGDRGCEPILPEAPCPSGFLAVPGETACHEVASCAPGKWGDIAVEPDTEHVDASYSGMDSDGTALKPWTTIQAAIDAAASGAIVAIAQGSYAEDVFVSDNPVRLWGVCPELVEVVGVGSQAAITIYPGASDTGVRGLAITGSATGIFLVGSLDVLLDRLWLHDTADRAINVQNDLGPTGMTLRSSLVERSTEVGVFAKGSDVTAEASVVRATQPNAQGLAGRGFNVRADNAGAPSTLVLRGSLIERNREAGVHFSGTNATVEASVVRDVEASPAAFGGNGMNAQADPSTGAPSTLVLRTSLIAQSDVALLVEGSAATVERCIIRDTRGRGLDVHADPTTGAPSTLLLDRCLVHGNQEIGVFVEGGSTTVEASAVRATQPAGSKGLGRGIAAEATPTTGTGATLVIRSSLVEQSHDIGIFVAGSQATVEASLVRDTRPNALGERGQGVSAQSDVMLGISSTLELRTSLVEQSHTLGVAIIGSTGTIASSLVRETRADSLGKFGDGILVASESGYASANILGVWIDQSFRAAIATFGGYTGLAGSALSCQAFDLDYETYLASAPELENLGGNRCGCPEASSPCKAVSANLEPPAPVEPTE